MTTEYEHPFSVTLRMSENNEPISLIVYGDPNSQETNLSIFGYKFLAKDALSDVLDVLTAEQLIGASGSLQAAYVLQAEKMKQLLPESATRLTEDIIFFNAKAIEDFLVLDVGNLAAKKLIGKISKEIIREVSNHPSEKNKTILRAFVEAGAIIDPQTIKAAENGNLIKTRLEERLEKAKGIGYRYNMKFREITKKLSEKSDFILGNAHSQFSQAFSFATPINKEQLILRISQHKDLLLEVIREGMSIDDSAKISAQTAIKQFNQSIGSKMTQRA